MEEIENWLTVSWLALIRKVFTKVSNGYILCNTCTLGWSEKTFYFKFLLDSSKKL